VTDYGAARSAALPGAESLNAIAGNLTADGADDTEKKRRNPNRGWFAMVFFKSHRWTQMNTDSKNESLFLICGYLCLSVAGIGFESPAFRPALGARDGLWGGIFKCHRGKFNCGWRG
jgi:hypothetical protein